MSTHAALTASAIFCAVSCGFAFNLKRGTATVKSPLMPLPVLPDSILSNACSIGKSNARAMTFAAASLKPSKAASEGSASVLGTLGKGGKLSEDDEDMMRVFGEVAMSRKGDTGRKCEGENSAGEASRMRLQRGVARYKCLCKVVRERLVLDSKATVMKARNAGGRKKGQSSAAAGVPF